MAADKPGDYVTEAPQAPLWKRLAWFVGLWAGGVAVVGAIAYGIKYWLGG